MSVLEQYPELFSLLIVGVGFVVAHLLSRWSKSGLALMENGLRHVSPQRAELSTRTERAVVRIVYYSVLGLFILLATRSLGVQLVGQWLDSLIVFIPRLLLGGAIIFAGYLLGTVARSLVASLVAPGSRQLVPQLVQYLVVTAAVITGLGQMSVDISFLAMLIIVVVGALLGSLSLAFALGSRDVVANMLSRRELDRFRVGDRISVADVEGRIVEITRTGVVLDRDEGLTYIPASRFASSIVVQRPDESPPDG